MKSTQRLVLVSLATLTMACGEKKKEQNDDGFQVTRKKEEQVVEKKDNVIALASNDLMQFDKDILTVRSGKPVTLTLRHTGTMDKMVMGHNFVLLKQGADMAAFASEAAAARENDYIPKGTEQTIAYTKMIGGGETTTITFDAPAPGTYDFICSFPGHYGVMQGKFIVE